MSRSALGFGVGLYSTYPAYVSDDSAHKTALEYALKLFKANGEVDCMPMGSLVPLTTQPVISPLGTSFLTGLLKERRMLKCPIFSRKENRN